MTGGLHDRRRLPANGRVALESLRGRVEAERFVAGEPATVRRPVVDLCAAPGGPRDRQLLYGEGVRVLEEADGHAFVVADKDGYCGHVDRAALGAPAAATHWVSAAATHLYAAADIKSPDRMMLSLGARLAIRGEAGDFLETREGLFVPRRHVSPVGMWAADPVAVAERLLGTPYLWGGNSRSGIDCSGLVQAALVACGRDCPGDSDMQQVETGAALPPGAALRRGDLVFWKGHVALAAGPGRIIHANAHDMAVAFEDLGAAVARIAAQGGGPVLACRRP